MSRWWQRWALRALGVTLVGLVAWVFTSWIGMRPRPVLVFALALAGFAVAWVFTDVAGRVTGIDWRPPRRRVVPRHGLDPRFLRMASLMRDETDRGLVALRVHQQLVRIVDDRLMAHHGLDRHTQPDQASRVLGPSLTRYLSEHPTARDLHPRYLHDLLTRIEAL